MKRRTSRNSLPMMRRKKRSKLPLLTSCSLPLFSSHGCAKLSMAVAGCRCICMRHLYLLRSSVPVFRALVDTIFSLRRSAGNPDPQNRLYMTMLAGAAWFKAIAHAAVAVQTMYGATFSVVHALSSKPRLIPDSLA